MEQAVLQFFKGTKMIKILSIANFSFLCCAEFGAG
jgi:hypothetical protein